MDSGRSCAYGQVMSSDRHRRGGATEWRADEDELFAFARVLVETDQLGDAHRVIDFFREPQRWSSTYRIWSELGRPERHGQPHFQEMRMRFFAERNSLRARGA
jgi:hypothetical protein